MVLMYSTVVIPFDLLLMYPDDMIKTLKETQMFIKLYSIKFLTIPEIMYLYRGGKSGVYLFLVS